MPKSLAQSIKTEARRLGFTLAGITTPDPPPHWSVFENWLTMGRHGQMIYLADERSRARRLDPRRLLPECRSILVLGIRYPAPPAPSRPPFHPLPNPPPFRTTGMGEGRVGVGENGGTEGGRNGGEGESPHGRVAAYAWGMDYHLVLPERLRALSAFVETQVGHPIPNRAYTDSGPILERDLAQRAGLGWIGKNTNLIHPRIGSYFLLAEILLGIQLEPDPPFESDRCGACRRCIEACPTQCILPDRSLDARRCISYLTIELKEEIPPDLRSRMGEWVFGCDVCQMVCPWNRFAEPMGDPAFSPRPGVAHPDLAAELSLTPEAFSRKFKNSPVKRAKRGGYLRNAAVALGNAGDPTAAPALEQALHDPDPLVRSHAAWALERIHMPRILLATSNRGKVREIQALLNDLDVELFLPADIGLELHVTEEGQTYAENAARKALVFARASGMTALGDDSGLEVDALCGQPGLYSARFAPWPNASDADRRAYLLQQLQGKPRPWTARFRATVAVATPGGEVRYAVGECEGEIIPEERGTNGFGYDPIFLIPALGRTMAELSMDEKNRLSHRARAMMNARPILLEISQRMLNE